jgi:predicted ATPase/class 3 adenylate cyclase
MARDLPSGTVTFLFTDIEGSTKLLHELGPDGYAEALAEHRRIVREAFTARGGVEVDTQGDAFFVAFPEASGAVTAAREAQEALAKGPIRVRMGLHTGEPTVTAEGYVGVDVHEGARIAAAAHGGQVVFSRRTMELAGEAIAFIDLGEHRFKDLPEPVWIYQLGDENFPPLKTLSNTNLPTPASSFLGRERELVEAAELLDRNRIITILGPGGAGKTRFSIELASRHLDRFPNGVFWVPLATVTDPDRVLETAGRVVGAKDGLADHIGTRQMMLLLDNLEQVIDAAPKLAELAEACPNLTVVVTSRELMRVRGEHSYAIPALDLDEGVALFTERAGVPADDTVIELCRRLEGLPLAIELAAARATVMTPAQLVAKLRERLDFLRGGRDADPRQRTLRATIEWSHDLLSDVEKRAFARLGVFIGGWTLESAKAVADVDVDQVQSLVEKSLARRTDDRFWMLETIREFAVERFELSDAAGELRQRFADFMFALARSANLTSYEPGVQRHELVIPEQDNMRGAMEWAIEAGAIEFGLRLAMALENFWVTNNPGEGVRWYERLFEAGKEIDPALRAGALRDLGGCAQIAGMPELADKAYADSLQLFRSLGDRRQSGELVHRQATRAIASRELPLARRLLEESLEIALAVGNRWGECQVLGSLAHVSRYEGDMNRAVGLFERSGAIAAELGKVWWETNTVANLTELDLAAGRIEQAAVRARRTLTLSRDHGGRGTMPWGLMYFARVAAGRGELARAGVLWGAVEAEKARGNPSLTGADPDYDELVAPLVQIDDPTFERGRADGLRLGLEEAVELALANE